MRVPNAEDAVVEIEKIRDYCLEPDHEIGGHKARVFASSLGLTQKDSAKLRDVLLEAVRSVDCEPGKLNQFGEMYIVDFEAVNMGKTAVVRSVWIIETGEMYPRLVSCYVI